QKPLAGALVEVERFNPTPPKELPPDEQITRTVKTDPNGVATCTLTEPGWWCLTAQTDGGRLRHEGKPYPLRRRAPLGVFGDEKGCTSPGQEPRRKEPCDQPGRDRGDGPSGRPHLRRRPGLALAGGRLGRDGLPGPAGGMAFPGRGGPPGGPADG